MAMPGAATMHHARVAMMSLDVKTAFAVAGLVCLLAALTVGVLRRLHEPSRAAMVRLSLSLGAGGFAMLLAAHHETAPWIPVSVAMIAGGTMVAFGYQAVRMLYGESPQTPAIVGALGLLALLLTIAPDGRFSLTLHYGFQALFAGAGAWTVLRAEDPEAERSRRLLVGCFSVFALAALVRVVRTVATDLPSSIEQAHQQLWAQQGWVPVLTMLVPLVLMMVVLSVVLSRQLDALRVLTCTDELTGTASRRYLFDQGEHWLARRSAERAGSTALMMIDIDNFKSINDRYGHGTGDRVLRHVAQVLGRSLAPDAVLARYGGEEFCVLTPVADAQEAAAIAEMLRRAAEISPYLGEDGTIMVTVSVGLALHRQGNTLAELLRVADRRVYLAKADGRNRVSDERERLEVAVV